MAAADIITDQAPPDVASAAEAHDKGAVNGMAHDNGGVNGVSHGNGAAHHVTDGNAEAAHVAGGNGVNGKGSSVAAANPGAADKPKRKYVKSGKFVGKYNSQRQKQGEGQAAVAEKEGVEGEGLSAWHMHFVSSDPTGHILLSIRLTKPLPLLGSLRLIAQAGFRTLCGRHLLQAALRRCATSEKLCTCASNCYMESMTNK